MHDGPSRVFAMSFADAPIVRCPTCGADSRFAPDNPSRPFCSPRCKGIDLGAWASESFRVAAVPDPHDPEGDAAAPPFPHH